MKKIITILLAAIALNAHSQSFQPKETPELEFALQLKVTLGETYTIDNTQHGKRIVIPITGGTFEGPLLKGTIINGGADYQLSNGSRTELEAIYSIKTDDGIYIHVRAPQFEAPADSKYGWLNNALFICAPEWNQEFKGIVLNVWKVK